MAHAGGGWDLERLRSARTVTIPSHIPAGVTLLTPPWRDHPPDGTKRVPGYAKPAGGANAESAVGFLLGWVSDGEAH